MFYLLYKWLFNPDPESVFRFLRLFKSQPFRAICAAATAFLVVYYVMPWFIGRMRRAGLREQARHYSELDTGHKSEVPTMGGLVLLPAIILAAFLWCDPLSGFVLLAAGAAICGGALGAMDDIAKIRRRASDDGLSRAAKYAAQAAIGLALGLVLISPSFSPIDAAVPRESFYIPFVKYGYYVGLANLAIITFFIVFSTNAVNLTDGMDGLAAMPATLVFIVLGLFAYIIGHEGHAAFLQFFPYGPDGANHALPGAGELAILCAAGAGACAGFLWYNAFPATIMMGDTGSLGLGAMLGAAAVLIRQECIFLIAGGVFVLELGSSFIQDYVGLKLLGRRIFFRAPFHSSMLHRGISESKVTIRMWIISGALAVIALSMLKLR